MAQGNLGNFFLGAPARIEQIPRFDQPQQAALAQILQSGLQGFNNPYQGFEPIEQYARTQFQQQTVPSLAERFTSLGNNKISSPAFASQLGYAGSNLEQGLAALRSQYGMQNRNQLMQLLELGLTPKFENVGVAGQEGLAQKVVPGLAEKAVDVGGNAIGWLIRKLLGIPG